MTNEQTTKAKWLRELADEIEAKPKDEESQEPEYTLAMFVSGHWRIKRGDRYVADCLTVQVAANIANALNSFETLLNTCSEATCLLDHIERECVRIDAWRVAILRTHIHKAHRLATSFDDDGRLKDG